MKTRVIVKDFAYWVQMRIFLVWVFYKESGIPIPFSCKESAVARAKMLSGDHNTTKASKLNTVWESEGPFKRSQRAIAAFIWH